MAIEQTASSPAIRASDAERRRLTDLLKQACVEGRLTLDEFGERMDRAIKARTRAELDELTNDLPAAGVHGTELATTSRASRLKGAPPAPGAPVIVIQGLVLMGDLTVRDKPEHDR